MDPLLPVAQGNEESTQRRLRRCINFCSVFGAYLKRCLRCEKQDYHNINLAEYSIIVRGRRIIGGFFGVLFLGLLLFTFYQINLADLEGYMDHIRPLRYIVLALPGLLIFLVTANHCWSGVPTGFSPTVNEETRLNRPLHPLPETASTSSGTKTSGAIRSMSAMVAAPATSGSATGEDARQPLLQEEDSKDKKSPVEKPLLRKKAPRLKSLKANYKKMEQPPIEEEDSAAEKVEQPTFEEEDFAAEKVEQPPLQEEESKAEKVVEKSLIEPSEK